MRQRAPEADEHGCSYLGCLSVSVGAGSSGCGGGRSCWMFHLGPKWHCRPRPWCISQRSRCMCACGVCTCQRCLLRT
eukprot:9225050-Pyramimonas_sp.AAC.1